MRNLYRLTYPSAKEKLTGGKYCANSHLPLSSAPTHSSTQLSQNIFGNGHSIQGIPSPNELRRSKKEEGARRDSTNTQTPLPRLQSEEHKTENNTGMWMVQIYKSCQYVYPLPKMRTLQSSRMGNMIFSCYPCSTLTYRMASSARRRDGYRELLKLAAAATSEPLCKEPRPPHRRPSSTREEREEG